MAQYNFRIHVGTDVKTFTEVRLAEYANEVGLAQAAPDCYSWLLVMHLYLHAQVNDIDPSMIVAELKALEGNAPSVGTKAATQFTGEPLKGLWHKHFFSAQFVGHNLVNHHAGGRLGKLVEQVMDPAKYPVITAELLDTLTHEVVTGAFEKREAQNKLTGEWIVFAKHEGKNYYLCLATHETGDQVIYDQIKSICFRQFPFLSPVT